VFTNPALTMTTLCLACSSSLPPKSTQPIFTTPCCSRPICPQCISANPRLARYNPCLACLGGVGVVNAGASTSSVQQLNALASRNVDGAVRDEDTFVLGDDEDDDQEPTDPQPPATAPVESSPETPATPSKYYIKRGDTLQGIALRFGLDASVSVITFILSLTLSRAGHSAASTTSRPAPSVPPRTSSTPAPSCPSRRPPTQNCKRATSHPQMAAPRSSEHARSAVCASALGSACRR
jgi:hypothetical protein